MLYLAYDGVKGGPHRGSTLVRPGRGFLQFSLSRVLLERDYVKIAWNAFSTEICFWTVSHCWVLWLHRR